MHTRTVEFVRPGWRAHKLTRVIAILMYEAADIRMQDLDGSPRLQDSSIFKPEATALAIAESWLFT